MSGITSSEQDEDDLRELIDRYRTGYSLFNIVERISARWAAQNREVYDTIHRPHENIPVPAKMQELMEKFMEELEDDRSGS